MNSQAKKNENILSLEAIAFPFASRVSASFGFKKELKEGGCLSKAL